MHHFVQEAHVGIYFGFSFPPAARRYVRCAHMELGQVGASWASNCDFWYLLGALGRLALILNFNKSMLESDGDQNWRPGGLPAPFWRPPATILEGLEGPKAY